MEAEASRRCGARSGDLLTYACVAALSLTVLGAEVRGAGARDEDRVWLEREALLMGTTLRIEALAGSRNEAARAIEAAFDSVASLESRLSSWEADTPLGALREDGRASLDSATARLLATARDWSLRTGGAFDPTVGALVESWDLRGDGRRPSGSELAAARRASGWGCVVLEVRSGELAARCPGAWIDAGAFGKGAALKVAARALEAGGAASGLLDFGGQIAVFGAPRGEVGGSTVGVPSAGRYADVPRDAWPVSVAHPDRRGVPALRLAVEAGSVATTSASERFLVVRDTVRGHVLDPKSGEPIRRWGSVTVHASDPLAADVLSTALFVMGPEAGLAWAEDHEGVAALFLRSRPEGLEATWDGEMAAMIVRAPGEADVTFGAAERRFRTPVDGGGLKRHMESRDQ